MFVESQQKALAEQREALRVEALRMKEVERKESLRMMDMAKRNNLGKGKGTERHKAQASSEDKDNEGKNAEKRLKVRCPEFGCGKLLLFVNHMRNRTTSGSSLCERRGERALTHRSSLHRLRTRSITTRILNRLNFDVTGYRPRSRWNRECASLPRLTTRAWRTR